jgi:carboxymethylenebutenolidase
LAYRAALNPSVSAAACFYATDIHSGTLGAGKADDSLARMNELRAETLFVWGRQDPHVPFAGRQTIRARLEEVVARYEWHEVNAANAFLRDEGPRYDPARFIQSMGWMLAMFQRTLLC